MIFRFDGAQKRFHTNPAWKHVLNHQSYGSFNTFISGLMKCTNGRNETDEDMAECVTSIANKNQWLSYWSSIRDSQTNCSHQRIGKCLVHLPSKETEVEMGVTMRLGQTQLSNLLLAINAELCCQMGHEAHLHFCRLNYGPFIWRILQCTYEL